MASLVKVALCKLNGINDLNFKFDDKTNSLDLSKNSKLHKIVYKNTAIKGLKGVSLLKDLDLRELNLSNSSIKDFWAAKSFTELQVLNLSKSKIKMNNLLLDIPSLKTLYISRDNEKSKILDKLRNRGVKIILVD